MKPSLMQNYARAAAECCRSSLSAALHSSSSSSPPSTPISIDVFLFMKRLVHLIGFRCWIGEAAGPYLDRLIVAFDALDPERTFVDLASLLRTVLTRRSAEYAALDAFEEIVRSILASRDPQRAPCDTLDSLFFHYTEAGAANPERQVAVDVFILQLASLANLYSAVSWLLINLAAHPELRSAARAQAAEISAAWASGERGAGERQEGAFDLAVAPLALAQWELVDACMQESLRLSQRSLTLRKVLKPVALQLSEGGQDVVLQPGCYVATLLSVTNPLLKDDGREGPLDGESSSRPSLGFEPSNFSQNVIKNHLVDHVETVSTFGHGRHACPGRSFALMIAKIILLSIFENTDDFSLPKDVTWPPAIPASQIGAVGRTINPVYLNFHLHSKAII